MIVTGSSGQIGSYVADALAARGREWIGVDLRPSRRTSIVADVRTLSGPIEADGIVHCAAQVSVAASVEDPRFDASQNVDGTLAMLERARRTDARFVLVSSAAVYGEPATVPVREDAPLAPLAPYGLSKAAGEAYARLYASLYGLSVVVLRPFNVYSPRQDPSSPYSGVVARFLADAAQGRAPCIAGDGSATRDFVHASDVARAIVLALDDPRAAGETLNVGTGRATSIRELAETVLSLAGRTELQPTRVAPRPGDVGASVADVSKLRSLGFGSTMTLAEGLQSMVTPRAAAVAPPQEA